VTIVDPGVVVLICLLLVGGIIGITSVVRRNLPELKKRLGQPEAGWIIGPGGWNRPKKASEEPPREVDSRSRSQFAPTLDTLTELTSPVSTPRDVEAQNSQAEQAFDQWHGSTRSAVSEENGPAPSSGPPATAPPSPPTTPLEAETSLSVGSLPPLPLLPRADPIDG
jgi:hypothetical protein